MAKARPGAVGRGAASPAFRDALSEINLECARHKKCGRIAYITKPDVKAVYAKYGGSCAFCGYALRSHKRGTDSLTLMFYQPLKYGGAIDRENLIPVCRRCKYQQSPKPRPKERIPDLNTIPDLIERLVVAVKYGEEPSTIKTIKQEINVAIEEFVTTLTYKVKPYHSIKAIVNGENSVADVIEKLIGSPDKAKEELKQTLNVIMETKSYKIINEF